MQRGGKSLVRFHAGGRQPRVARTQSARADRPRRCGSDDPAQPGPAARPRALPDHRVDDITDVDEHRILPRLLSQEGTPQSQVFSSICHRESLQRNDSDRFRQQRHILTGVAGRSGQRRT